MPFFRTVVFPLLVCVNTAAAQSVLRLPVSTRALGMANAAVTGRDEDVLFYNPAQIVIARGTSVSMERLSATATSGSLASVIRFSTGGIALGMSMVDFQAQTARTDLLRDEIIAAGPVAGTSVAASVGLAQVIKTIRIGVAGKYVEDHVGAARDGRAMFDFGLSRDLLRFYSAGIAVQNVSFRAKLPVTRPRLSVGGAMSRGVGPYDVLATAAVVADSYRGDTHIAPAGGLEVGWGWISGYSIAARAGLRSPLAGERAPTLGAGFNADRLSVDYALETLTGSRVAHRFGLRIR